VAGEEGGSVVRMWKDQETDREYDGENCTVDQSGLMIERCRIYQGER
jgi:hypothetical protein